MLQISDNVMRVTMTGVCFDDNGYISINGTQVWRDSGACCSAGCTYTDVDVTHLLNTGSNTIYGFADDCCAWGASVKADFRIEYAPAEAEPELGEEGKCPPKNAKTSSSFNISNGNLYDEYQVSPETKLPVNLSYNSRSKRVSRFGHGWQPNIEYRLLINPDNSIVAIYPDGREELFSYDGWSYSSSTDVHDQLITDGSGYILTRKDNTRVFFNNNGKITSVIDSNNNQTTYTFDNNALISLTDPNGRTLSFASNELGLVSAITNSYDLTTTFTYDVDDNLTSIIDTAGRVRTFVYDANHNLIQKTDARGSTVSYTYDSEDRVLSSTDAAGNSYTAEYLSATQTRLISPGGSSTTYLNP